MTPGQPGLLYATATHIRSEPLETNKKKKNGPKSDPAPPRHCAPNTQVHMQSHAKLQLKLQKAKSPPAPAENTGHTQKPKPSTAAPRAATHSSQAQNPDTRLCSRNMRSTLPQIRKTVEFGATSTPHFENRGKHQNPAHKNCG